MDVLGHGIPARSLACLIEPPVAMASPADLIERCLGSRRLLALSPAQSCGLTERSCSRRRGGGSSIGSSCGGFNRRRLRFAERRIRSEHTQRPGSRRHARSVRGFRTRHCARPGSSRYSLGAQGWLSAWAATNSQSTSTKSEQSLEKRSQQNRDFTQLSYQQDLRASIPRPH
jgi:hypothetical protein